MPDIANTAEIKLNVTVDKRGLNELRRAMKSITTAAKADKAAKDMRLLTNQLEKLKKELREAKKELKGYQQASKKSEQENKRQAKSFEQLGKNTKTFFKRHQVDSKRYVADQKRAAKETEQSNRRSEQAIKKQERAHRQFVRTAQRTSRATSKWMRSHNALRPAIDNTKKSQDQLNKSTHIGAASSLRLSKQLSRGSKEFKKMSGFIGRFSKALSEAEHDMDALFRASFRLSIVGFTLQRFSDNIRRWGGDIMDTFSEFEYTTLRAAGALEIWRDTTIDGEKGTTVLANSITEAAQRLKLFSAEEVAQAVYYWGSATGQVVDSADDIAVTMGGLSTIMKAAAMTNTDYETTIKGVYSILTQFYNGSLEEATSVTEKLFLTTQKTAAEFTDLIGSFKMVGPVAAQAGATFDQVNEAFGTLSDLGLRGSMAGRGLRQLFIQLVRPSGPAQKKWSELFEQNPFGDGRTMRETIFPEGDFIGITEAMNELAKATEHLNAADRLQAISRVTTANSLPLTIALISKQRNEMLGLAEAQDKFKDSDPTEYFRENWMLLSNSWKAARASLDRMIESIKIGLGGQIATVMKPLIDTWNEWLKSVEALIQRNPELTEFVTRVAAVAAVLSSIAGVAFVVAGSLVGLFAALRLVWVATEKWRGVIAKTFGVLTIFFGAILDNFDYIRDNIIAAVENLSDAFGDLGESTTDVSASLGHLLDPIRELAGFAVRLASDIIRLTSEFVAWFASIELVANSGVFDAIIKALEIIVSARILMGIATLVKTWKLFNVTVATGATTGALATISYHLKGIASGSVVAGIKGLAASFRGLLASIGPIGWAMLGLSALMIADELPIIGDLVRSLEGDWKRLNEQLHETTDYFGADVGNSLRDMLEGVSTFTPQIEEARTVLTSLGEDMNTFIKDNALDEMSDEVTLFTPDMDTSAVEANMLAVTNVIARSAQDLNGEWLGLHGAYSRGEEGLLEIQVKALEQQNNWADEYVQAHHDFMIDMRSAGRDIEMAGTDWGKAILGLMDNVGAQFGAGGTVMAPAGAMVDNVLSTILTVAPDRLRYSEVGAFTDRMNSLLANTLSDAISVEEMMSILGSRVGQQSSIINTEVAAMINSLLQETDFYALRDALYEPLDILRGESLMEIVGNVQQYGDVQPLLEALLPHYDALLQEIEGGGGLGLEQIEARLKNALEVMTTNLFMDAMPNLEEVATQIQTMALSQDYEMLADYLLQPYADGMSLVQLAASGDISGASIDTIKAIAKGLVDAGYGGDALAQFVAEEAKSDGEETSKSLKEQFLEGLGNLSEISVKDFKEAMKAGSAADRIAKASKEVLKMWSMAATSPEAREYRRESTQQVTDAALTSIRVGRRRNQAKKVRRGVRQGTQVNIGAIQGGNKQEASLGEANLRSLFSAAPNKVSKAIKASELPQKTKDRLMKDFWGIVETTPPSPPAIASAMESITSSMESVYDPLSSVQAPSGGGKEAEAPSEPQGPKINFSKMLSGLPDAAEVITAITTSTEKVSGMLVTGLQTALAAADTSPVETAAASTMTAVAAPQGKTWVAAFDGGMMLADTFVTAEGDGIRQKSSTITEAAAGANSAAMAPAIPRTYLSAKPVGEAAGQGIADGIRSKIAEIQAALAAATAAAQGESPPKVGPLKEIDKWGENVGRAWSEGVTKGMSAGEEYILSSGRAFTNTEIKRNDKREIKIKMEVSSPDGTVNRQKQGEIRKGTLDAIAVMGLEHYMTVG